MLVAMSPGQCHRDQEGMLRFGLGSRRGCLGLILCAWSIFCPRLGCAARECWRARRDGVGMSPFFQELPLTGGNGRAQQLPAGWAPSAGTGCGVPTGVLPPRPRTATSASASKQSRQQHPSKRLSRQPHVSRLQTAAEASAAELISACNQWGMKGR